MSKPRPIFLFGDSMTTSQWLTGLGAALTVTAPMIAPLYPTAGIILGAIAAGLTAFNQSLRHPTHSGRVAAAKKQLAKDVKASSIAIKTEDE